MNQIEQKQPLVSLPKSVQDQLDRATSIINQSQSALGQGDPELAIVRATEGLRVLQALAAHGPDQTAMLFAAMQGHQGFEVETTERIDRYQFVDRKFLGLTIARDLVNVPTITRTHKRVRVI